ncbi:guanine-1-methyltransferase-domain-containing protein [Umbelopsis sp. AD052]|nr:guanine-1-methyltransferase-domain-containing protein [Umbelopsis sp. AD052]
MSKLYPHEKPDYKDPKYAGLSRRAIKRHYKQERWDATRDERRDAAKAKKKQKKEAKKRMYEEGLITPPQGPKRIRLEDQVWSKLNVVIDCDFNSMMVEKEINSMQTQICRCYSSNRSAKIPCPITVTSFGGELEQVFDKKTPSRTNWKGVEFTTDTYLEKFDKEKLVYLSADSENVATELDENKVYIIGGIVDKNRYKGLCQEKAEKEGIPTAQLPIGEYLQLATRKVLTVNHVYEIMLKWLECKDWNQAFLEVIPQRKFKDFNAINQPNSAVGSAAGEDSSDEEAVDEGSDTGATLQDIQS